MATVREKQRRSPAPRKSLPAVEAADRFGFRIPTSAMSLAGFRAWACSDDFPQHIRAAYIAGEIFIEMSNEELQTHVAVKTEISRVLSTLTRQLDEGTFYADGILISNEPASVSNNPDATFFRHDAVHAGRVRLIPRQGEQRHFIEIEGTPDWVLEVVSQSSVRKDTERLRQAYHRAGIAEYWLIDARGAEITFHILNHRKTGYSATLVREGWQRSRIFGRSFRLDRQINPAGLWVYTLHVQ